VKWTKKDEAGQKLLELAQETAIRVTSTKRTSAWMVIGKYRGFDIYGSCSTFGPNGLPMPFVYFKINGEVSEITANTDNGVFRSMDACLEGLERRLEVKKNTLQRYEADIRAALMEMERPWEHEQKFRDLEARLRALDEILNQHKKPDEKQELPPIPLTADQRKTVVAKDKSTAQEAENALLAIEAMLHNPDILARFGKGVDILSPAGLDELANEIETKQALFDLGTELVQLDLFGGFASVELSTSRKSRRR